MRRRRLVIGLLLLLLITFCIQLPGVAVPCMLSSEQIRTEADKAEPLPDKLRPWNEEDVVVLAKMLYGEAGNVPSDTEKAACVWCVLNRVDLYCSDITTETTKPHQFVGYRETNPVREDLRALCLDVLERWYREKQGETDVGRVLPPDYTFFSGDGVENFFRNAFEAPYDIWDWSLLSPYDS